MVIRFIRKMEQNTKNNGLHEGTAGASRQSGVAAERRATVSGGRVVRAEQCTTSARRANDGRDAPSWRGKASGSTRRGRGLDARGDEPRG